MPLAGFKPATPASDRLHLRPLGHWDRPLYLRERDLTPIVQEAGWAIGQVWTGAENLVHTGIRSWDPPVLGESLYRLSYLGHQSPQHWDFHHVNGNQSYARLSVRVFLHAYLLYF